MRVDRTGADAVYEWAALDEYRFTESAEVAGEFTLETQLEAGMLLKVVGISEGEETSNPLSSVIP